MLLHLSSCRLSTWKNPLIYHCLHLHLYILMFYGSTVLTSPIQILKSWSARIDKQGCTLLYKIIVPEMLVLGWPDSYHSAEDANFVMDQAPAMCPKY